MLQTHITNKQKEILLLLYRFRFLNRLQLQQLLKHTTYKRINLWLKDLTEKKYLTRIFKRSWTENSVPAKYYIAKQGIRFLKTQPDCKTEYLKKLYREKDRSQQFIDRCLFIADIYLCYLTDNINNTATQNFYTQSNYNPTSIIRDIHPDFVILTGKEGIQHFTLYQLFPEGVPRYAVRKRIEQYISFLTEGDGSDLPASLYLIVQSEAHYKYLTRHIQKILEDESIDVQIYLSTYDQVVQHGIAQSTFTNTLETVAE
jgi:hypothetical protein